MNTRLDITYDGTRYGGFQVQDNAPTIQGEIERALAVIYKQPLRISGAGRTDAGVHALGQVANYRAPFAIPPGSLPPALNSLLPRDIVVIAATPVAEDFHARFDAVGKIYSYTVDRGLYPRVTSRLFSYHVPDPLDRGAMERAARVVEGRHDFAPFQGAGGSVSDTFRTLYRVSLQDRDGGRFLKFEFEGEGFLFRMVRLLTGSLLRVGLGKLSPEELAAALGDGQRGAAGPTAPAHGLCLEAVLYGREYGTTNR